MTHWTILRPDSDRPRYVIAICDLCGTEKSVFKSSITTGQSKSCGCSRVGNLVHGMSKTRTHHSWTGLRQRCNDPNHNRYHRYGGRGITYPPHWDTFEGFYEDMGECPEGYSIDRIDNDGDYSKDNCKWSSAKEQARNRSTTLLIDGISLAERCEKDNIHYASTWKRIKKLGMTYEEALNHARKA